MVARPFSDFKLPNEIQVGDHVNDIQGMMDFSFGNWRLRPISLVNIIKNQDVEDPVASIKDSTCDLTVASDNVENLDPKKSTMSVFGKQIVDSLVHALIDVLNEMKSFDIVHVPVDVGENAPWLQ